MLKACLCATVIFGAGVCHADWQYTNWTMTRSQVEAAILKSGGEVMPPFKALEKQAGDDPHNPFRTPYTAGGIKFSALFFIERQSDKLASVRLVPTDTADCERINSALLQRYGKPESEKDTSIRYIKQMDTTWRDTADRNYIVLNDYLAMGTRGCSVEYKPLVPSSTKGF